MITSPLQSLKRLRAPKAIARLLLVSLGLTSGVFGQATLDSLEAWTEYMSFYWREGAPSGGGIGYTRNPEVPVTINFDQTNPPIPYPGTRRGDGSRKLGEPNPVTGGRFYVTTTREVDQTGPSAATFQRGSYEFALADGYVPDIDHDQDAYTDDFERNWFIFTDSTPLVDDEGTADPADDIIFFNPQYLDWFAIPTDAFGNPLPIDAFPIFLSNGTLMYIDFETVGGNGVKASAVRPYSSGLVKIISAPFSPFARPVSFTDHSGQFTQVTNGLTETIGLSLYTLKKDYPNPSDVNTLETHLVPGVYTVEYPTVINPNLKAQAGVEHRLAPNGSLSVGLKRPTWLLRKLNNYADGSTVPMQQSWVNGRLRFDPNLRADITWDDLISAGLAASNDQILITINRLQMSSEGPGAPFEQEFPYGPRIWKSAAQYNTEIDIRGPFVEFDEFFDGGVSPALGGFDSDSDLDPGFIDNNGNWVPFVGTPAEEMRVNGVIKMIYSRLVNGAQSKDLSRSTLRVPVEMVVTYPSWQRVVFGADAPAALTGAGADADNDGLTNQQEFELGTDPLTPIVGVVNPTATNITSTSALLGGTVVEDDFYADLIGSNAIIFERGVVYSRTATNPAPRIGGSGVSQVPSATAALGTFVVSATGLMSETQYSYAAYTVTDQGTFYSNTATFTTAPPPPPTITARDALNITANSAILGGTLTFSPLNLGTVFERGVAYSISSVNSSPEIDGPGVTRIPHSTAAAGTYIIPVQGLSGGTQYSYVAYAITSLGTFYSSPPTVFSTLASPPLSVPSVDSPTSTILSSTSATLGGNISSTGNTTVTARGVVYSLSSVNSNPFFGGTGVTPVTMSGQQVGSFSGNVTGLTPGETYSFRVFATNSVGTAHSVDVGTFTMPTVPTVTTTTPAASVTSSSATLGGNVTSDGGANITVRGVVLSATNNNPLIGGAGVTNLVSATTPGTGVFTLNAGGLSQNTQYSYRAYATNAAGTSYGAVATFTTLSNVPTLSGATIANVTATTATLGGNVTNIGGSALTGRGAVVSTNSAVPPAIGGVGVMDFPVAGPHGVGAITASATGLTANTTYYFRTYATNASGAGYGPLATFTTTPVMMMGESQVQWVTLGAPTIQTQSESGGESTSEATQTVPMFVYEKSPAEIVDQVQPEIEISTDFTKWMPIDKDEWSVVPTAERVTATWNSTDPPPSSVFFRVGPGQ